MYSFHEELEKELNREKRLLTAVKSELALKSGGRLKRRQLVGKSTYYEIDEAGKIISEGLDSADKRVVAIKLHRILELQKKVLSQNIRNIEEFKLKYKRYSFDDLNALLPVTYRKIEFVPGKIRKRDTPSLGEEHLRDTLPIRTYHVAMDGTPVRSLAEMNIYNMLLSNRIPFEYERKLVLRSNEGEDVLYPDFTIRRKDKRNIYWEHIGMITDPEYSARFLEKLLIYHKHNIVPGLNLVLTFSMADMSINSMEIDRMIQQMIVPVVELK